MNNSIAFRTAAVFFADDNQVISPRTIHKKIIESIFIDNNNSSITIHDIIEAIKQKLDLTFDEKEITEVINKEKNKDFDIAHMPNQEDKVHLTEERFEKIKAKEQQNNILTFINHYCAKIYQGTLSSDQIQSALLKFFYELLNKNISAFKKIAKPGFKPEDVTIDSNSFSQQERDAINKFLEWDDSGKNRSIFNLVSYSIEYSLITNNYSSSETSLEAIRKKFFYLDNNIIYRAIGLNGESRKKRTIDFLRKCKVNGQSFYVSVFTIQEFNETIQFHVDLLKRIPFNKINPGLFSKYAIRPTIYEFFHNWSQNRTNSSFDLFIAHIKDLFEKFLKDFEIQKDYKVPFELEDDKVEKIIQKYTDDISEHKAYGIETSHRFDALNTYFIERKRGDNNISLTDTKYYFVSADQKLRSWDFNRNNFQPIALYPSHWLSILLKYFSRTDDDYKSFVQFLRLNQDVPIIREEKLQLILAGISEITEDFDKQEYIVERMIEQKFDKTIDLKKWEEAREKAADFAKTLMDEELQSIKESHKGEITKLEREKFEQNKKIIEQKELLLNEYQISLADIDKKFIDSEIRIEKKIPKSKLLFAVVILGWFVLNVVLIIILGWNVMEPYTYISGVSVLLFEYLLIIFTGKTFNPTEYFTNTETRVRNIVYSELGYNSERHKFLREQVDTLKDEIENLKK